MIETSENKSTYRAEIKLGKKITEELAIKEVEKWLDYKRVSDKKREESESQIETMVSAIMEGDLVVSESGNKLTHNLRFPIGNNEEIKTLSYKARLSVKDRNRSLKGIKPTDTPEYILGHISALSDQNKALISEMDTEDHNIAQSIALFFM